MHVGGTASSRPFLASRRGCARATRGSPRARRQTWTASATTRSRTQEAGREARGEPRRFVRQGARAAGRGAADARRGRLRGGPRRRRRGVAQEQPRAPVWGEGPRFTRRGRYSNAAGGTRGLPARRARRGRRHRLDARGSWGRRVRAGVGRGRPARRFIGPTTKRTASRAPSSCRRRRCCVGAPTRTTAAVARMARKRVKYEGAAQHGASLSLAVLLHAAASTGSLLIQRRSRETGLDPGDWNFDSSRAPRPCSPLRYSQANRASSPTGSRTGPFL